MIFKSRLYAKAALLFLCALAIPAQAGQLFPPSNMEANPKLPCPNGGVLTWNSDHVDCVNPTPGVTVSCPAGQVLTGINSGKAVCVTNSSAPPACSGPLQALQFDGANYHCVNANFGGMYFGYVNGGCRYANPYTGSCSCPPGYSGNQIWDFVVPSEPGWWNSSGNFIVYCVAE